MAEEEEFNLKTKLLSLFSIITLAGMLCAWATPGHAAKINVVTTLTDLADFTRAVGGDLVDVRSLATGVEDTHGVPMKPSFVPVMNRADLLVLVGFDCEHAFLPALLEASKNPRIQIGQAGYVDCSKGIVPRDVPQSTEHSAGDVHPYGNPHYILDPVLAKTAIANIYNALSAFAPNHQAEFARNRDAYLATLNGKIAEWEKEMAPFKGLKFVSYHEHWPYFAARFGTDLLRHHRAEAGHRPDRAPHRGTGRFHEGRPRAHRRPGAPVPREGAEAHRRADRRDHDNAAHHAGRRAQYGDVHQDDGLHSLHHGLCGQGKEMMAGEKVGDDLITLDNLTIGYNGQPVLPGITLSIARGSFTAILGANGSGKSTLLKTILGLLVPLAGRVITTAPLVFGYVPQATQFDPVYLLTGFEVALMGTYGRIKPGHFVPAAERTIVAEALSTAGAAEFARKRFSELSGGQKQRVLIARALATRPDVLVLDEPTAGVDHAATHAILDFISQIRQERNITVLLVTHDFATARKHAQRIVWLHDDKVINGAVNELLTPERAAEILEMAVC